MASVARDMTIASLVVIAVSAGIVGWTYLRPIERSAELAVVANGVPATIVVTGPARSASASGTERRVVLVRLASYQPPARGTVQVLMRALRSGAQPIELGRFAVFPNVAFLPGSEASERTYQVPARACPSEPGLACMLDIELTVVPVAGDGDGARVAVGGAAIEWR